MTVSVSDGMQRRIPHLRSDMYEFQICGFTSGGCGVQRKTTVKVISQSTYAKTPETNKCNCMLFVIMLDMLDPGILKL